MSKKSDARAFRRFLKTLDPERRDEFLELMRTSPSKINRELAAQATRDVARARREGCSGPRIKAFELHGVPYSDDGMLWARGRVKYGDAKRGTTRLTPELSIPTEDRYDLMSIERAAACNDPPSITGRQAEYLQQRNLTVQRQKVRKATRAEAQALRNAKRIIQDFHKKSEISPKSASN
jgi:hypothetical protein